MICDSAHPPDGIVQLPCGDLWCKPCLNGAVNHILVNRSSWPPFCHDIDINEVRTSLDDHLFHVLDQVKDELQSDNPVFCHVAQCSKFIPVDAGSDQGQFVRCPECHEFTCVECKAAKDQHVKPQECPDLITKEDKELAEKKGWKQCPNKRCQKLIEWAEGCPRMKCDCGTIFCYECGKLMKLEDGACPCLMPGARIPEGP